MYSDGDLHIGGVSPFGYLRINDRSHLPAAFRSVPRPSSPLGAKASTERPSLTPPTQAPKPARRTKPRPTLQNPETRPAQITHLPNQLTNHSIFTCQKNNPPGWPQEAHQAAALEARNSTQAPKGAGRGSRSVVRQTCADMEATGFEPVTPCLQSRCSTS
jgi:hypothetical protein